MLDILLIVEYNSNEHLEMSESRFCGGSKITWQNEF